MQNRCGKCRRNQKAVHAVGFFVVNTPQRRRCKQLFCLWCEADPKAEKPLGLLDFPDLSLKSRLKSSYIPDRIPPT